ncbi:HAD-superfamily hydrolase, subfamily IA, variant 3 [Thiorhodococcus drewsii AZ1]|uniref:HAD-superfamily hydrolase, subfamily IA, variant 3 n=1 Tax=Thiorhodococcus drewsii AZ1 TaxID=765913 RepID=G2E2W2_9GAMM|nr:HAD-IA family hydrolase [Thiorhodococcus drewsii]EGV30666.1 HAD-superfamily hydrolase, subfamily IA, variant 3 [Thiorhodococcus drewsii AZ1]
MLGFKALIFDVDGTLADTEGDGHRVAFNAAFVEVGLDWHWDPVLYGELLAVAGGKERIRYYMDRAGISLDAAETFVADLHAAKTRHYLSMLREGRIPLRVGVMRLLREAREAGIRLAVATTTTPENVVELLDHAGEPGLSSWFEVIAAGDQVPNKKPAPDIFVSALSELGLGPEDAVAIEDSDNGAQSALAAGIRALLVTVNDYTIGQDFGAAPLVVDALGGPEQPARALVGELDDPPWVDLARLDRLHRDVWAAS